MAKSDLVVVPNINFPLRFSESRTLISDMSSAPVVTVIQRRLTHYRVPFFVALRDRLGQDGISFRLLHGVGSASEAAKNDAGRIEWAEQLSTTYIGGGLCWQPFAKQAEGSSLVVITQENAMLANHFSLLRKPAPRLAFWGHGANLQGNSNALRERYKRWSTRRVDWYFAYTEQSVDLVVASGFPREKTTQLNNSIDMSKLKSDISDTGMSDVASLRAAFGLGPGPVGLFLGSLYSHKRLDFLLAAAQQLRSRVQGFQLLIVGDGPQRSVIENASSIHPWIRYVGAQKGRDKAAALRLATIILNPGLVGLGILDGFAAGVPMVTTDCRLHSPEIAYLNPNNGVMTLDDVDAYVSACEHLLTDDVERARLAAGCREAADLYTLPNMVENFTRGALMALDRSR